MSANMRPCGCGREGCDRMECITCGMSDCKWPGACYALCRECGGSARPSQPPMVMRDDGRPWMDMYCSDACQETCWSRAEAAGLVIKVSDVTPERLNEMFNAIGLDLKGVGRVDAS